MERRAYLLICLMASGVAVVRGQEAEVPPQVPAGEPPAAAQAESQPPLADKSPEADAVDKDTEHAERPKIELDDDVAKALGKRYPENLKDLKLIQKQTQRVIEHAMPAVVAVQVGGAFGSAVIVSPDGLVLTAGHVVGRPGQPVRFIFADGKTARGKTLGMYREIDSGMMKITDTGPWPYVDMAEADEIKTGEWVVALGQPGGFDGDRTPPVRLGRVLFAGDEVISTDCTLVGGDSGGPLFNMHGEVVGIHSRIGRRITDNFHVPISTYHAAWNRLLAGELWGAPLGSDQVAESRPLLGVTGNPNDSGCKLAQVFPGMPAARAGLKAGDVVRTFNGKSVDSFDDLVRMVYDRQPGDEVKLEVLRGEGTLKIELRLSRVRKPLPGSADMPKDADSNRQRGQP